MTLTIVALLIILYPLTNFNHAVAINSANAFGDEADLVLKGSVYRLFTALWLENMNVMALVTNCGLLLAVGWACESLIGHRRFLWLYLCSGVIGNGLTAVVLRLIWQVGQAWRWLDASSYVAVGLGASTAIAGVSASALFVLSAMRDSPHPRLRIGIIIFANVTLMMTIISPVVRTSMPLDGADICHLMGWSVGLIISFLLLKKAGNDAANAASPSA